MARFRKIDVRIWNDRKFRELDDKAKLAFFLVLTHPDTNQLGMLRSRSVALAFDLGWQTDAMSDAISMLCRMGMLMVDEKAGFIFIPNFLKYNPPNGPNAVKSWTGLLDQMPECDLLNHAVASLNPFILKLSEGLQKAIPDDIKDAINNAMQDDIKDAVRIQEKEKEKEREKEKEKENKKEKKSSPKKSVAQPDDVSSETWNDFVALRKAKHAPLTETALAGIRNEATKAGITLEEALSTCCMRGWQGFKADWVTGNNYRRQTTTQSGPRDIEPDFSQIDYGESGFM